MGEKSGEYLRFIPSNPSSAAEDTASGTGKALTAPGHSIPHVQSKMLVTAGKTVSFLNTSKCSDVTSIYWTSHFVAVYCRNILLNVETSEQLVCVLPGG